MQAAGTLNRPRLVFRSQVLPGSGERRTPQTVAVGTRKWLPMGSKDVQGSRCARPFGGPPVGAGEWLHLGPGHVLRCRWLGLFGGTAVGSSERLPMERAHVLVRRMARPLGGARGLPFSFHALLHLLDGKFLSVSGQKPPAKGKPMSWL